MFWERFENLCNKQNIKPNPLAKNIGISSGSVSKWKAGGTPNGESLLTIANHFNCSIDYLLGRTNNPKINHEIGKKEMIAEKLNEINYLSNEDLKFISQFHMLSDEDKKEIVILLELKCKKTNQKMSG